MRTYDELIAEYTEPVKKILSEDCDIDLKVSEIYTTLPLFISDLTDLLLLNRYEKSLTEKYLLAALVQGNTLFTRDELKDLINMLVKIYGADGMESIIYLQLHKVITKYMSFENPKSNPIGFILKYMMWNFRDFIKSKKNIIAQIKMEVPLKQEPVDCSSKTIEELNKEFFSNYGSIFNFGLPSKKRNLIRYILHAIAVHDISITELANSMSIRQPSISRLYNKTLLRKYYRN